MILTARGDARYLTSYLVQALLHVLRQTMISGSTPNEELEALSYSGIIDKGAVDLAPLLQQLIGFHWRSPRPTAFFLLSQRRRFPRAHRWLPVDKSQELPKS